LTQCIYVIGYPLRHSISPVFQQAALDFCGFDIKYEALEVEPGRLREAIEGLRRPQSVGANVTVPFKEQALVFMDRLDDAVLDIGAVNTVVKRDSLLVGYNTDALGFLKSLMEEGRFDPRDKTAVVLGAGGGGRAVCYALISAGVARLVLVNRTRQRAEEVAAHLNRISSREGRRSLIGVMDWGGAGLKAALTSADLIVNCTSLGMRHGGQEGALPLTSDEIPSQALVCDLVYNPAETPFLKAASQAGARVLGGLPMLVYQGAESFSLWTGREAPLAAMMAAARKALC